MVHKKTFDSRTADPRRHRAGAFVTQPSGYRAFIPKPLPPDPPLVVDEQAQSRLAEAERNLGRLDSLSQLLPDPDRFVYMYVRQEAVLSSQIEGTQASLSDLLDFEASERASDRPSDVAEIVNYLAALHFGQKRLLTLPISTRFLCEVHAKLMSGARGGELAKTPGQLRRSQNWIGGSSPSDAKFVPPPVHELSTAMGDLENFLNAEKRTPLLIEAALLHAQFETIHPFLDGNGRLGRLLITFLLSARRALGKPLLYLSYYFKINRVEYYDRLQSVRTHGDWEGWILFFLDGVASVADEAYQRAKKIIALREEDRARIRERLGRRSAVALDLLDLLVERPVVSSRVAQERLKKSQPTVDKLLSELVALHLLREISGQERGRRFGYSRYLELFEIDAQ